MARTRDKAWTPQSENRPIHSSHLHCHTTCFKHTRTGQRLYHILMTLIIAHLPCSGGIDESLPIHASTVTHTIIESHGPPIINNELNRRGLVLSPTTCLIIRSSASASLGKVWCFTKFDQETCTHTALPDVKGMSLSTRETLR